MVHFRFFANFKNASRSLPAEDCPPPPYSLPEEFSKEDVTEDQLMILKEYDTVIILDNSPSMKPFWEEARNALATLAEVASRYDTDGIDIHFLNEDPETHKRSRPWFYLFKRKEQPRRFRSEKDVSMFFEESTEAKIQEGCSPIAMRLEDITGRLLSNLRKRPDACKKTNYVVITDGKPTDDVEGVIVYVAQQLDELRRPLCQLGIQFVQVGNNPAATKFLKELDDNLKKEHKIRDIVDTEQYPEGVAINGARLAKLLTGGINRKMDNKSSATDQTCQPDGVQPTAGSSTSSYTPGPHNSKGEVSLTSL